MDTSTVPELSIVGNDTKAQLGVARKNTNEIFWGTLGQSRNYTISYKLKDDVTMADFSKAMNEYIQKQNARILFDHWMEADYLNKSDQTVIHKPDAGAAPKQITNSYSNAYLDTNDSDRDGLFDFVEWKIGTDSTKVDTDGDGVPDGQEFVTDNTDPLAAVDYLVSKPTTTTTIFDATKKTTIVGTVPKPLIADPGNLDKLIQITNQDAGDVIVKLQGYDEGGKTYTKDEYVTTKIPFDKLVTGEFSMDVNANVVPDGTKVVLVAYSPNAMNPVMGDPITFSMADKDKYNAQGGTLKQDYGKKAEEKAILDKVTVTETKDGQEVPVAADKVTSKKIKDVIPDPTVDGSDQTVIVEVTYADGTKEDATVMIDYGDAKDAYTPEGQDVQVDKDGTPNAADGIKNKDSLPEDTTYKWKTEVDTSKPGETTGIIVVTYPDQTTDEVEVKVNVVENRTDAEKNDPEGQEVQVDKDGTPNAADGIKNKDSLPEDTTYEWKTEVDTSKPGETTGIIVVTYPDQTTDEVEVKVNVVENRTDAEKNDPEGQEVQVDKDGTPNAADGIKNKDSLPEDTTYEWKTEVDTSKPGETTGIIVVTYPDQTTDEVEVKVNVVDKAPQGTDTEKYAATGGTVNKPYGQIATSDEVTAVVTTDAPEDKVQSIEVMDAIPTTGQNQPVNVKVTYGDGSTDTVVVTVNYGLAADVYNPEGQPVTVDKGSQPNAADGIANKGDFPENTTYGWETPVDTGIPGTISGTVIVTYPDASTDRVIVDVIVNDTATDTEKYTATGGTVNKPFGQIATSEEITAVVTTDAPEDKVQFIEVMDAIPTTGQNQPVNVKVTYGDGSTDTVVVTVNYGLAADVYNPEGQPVTVDKGSQPNAADGIANKGDFPENTTYGWEAPVDTSIPGTTSGTVIVTYPDASTDRVTVDVIVNDNRTDAEKYTPEGQDITVNKNEKPNPEDGIKNKDDLPKDTTYVWKEPIDTEKSGETTGIIVVTYPDQTTDEVEVKIKVVDPRSDAEKYDPVTIPEVIKPGEKPNLTDNIANLNDLPDGTIIKDITPDGAINTNKPGEYEGTLEVIYPDGSKETVTVKVKVEKPGSATVNIHNTENKQIKNVKKVTSSGPKTGDFTNLGVHATAALGSIVTLAGLFFSRRRKKENDEQ